MIPGSAASILLASAGSGLVIGQAFEGGYYAGTITYGAEAWLPGSSGDSYHLIMAPKASGDSSTYLQYKTSNTCDGAESTGTSAQSIWDGYHNTYTSVIGSSNAHPAANYCQALTIGGYSDWYLGAIEELKLVHTNLLLLADWQAGGSESYRTTTNYFGLVLYWASTATGSCESGPSGTTTAYAINTETGTSIAGFPKANHSFGARAIRRVAV
jgi:hypothetical protein